MAWECADCGEKEVISSMRNGGDSRRIVVCHHCGKPVCFHPSRVIADDDFGTSVEPPTARAAVHCADCKNKHHPKASGIEHAWHRAGAAAP